MASPLLTRDGAAPAGGTDTGVAGHYGDPMGEQRALARGIGVVDLSQLEVVAVSGPDRLSWLHSLSSQHVSALPPLASTELLLLDPHGHVAHAAFAVDDGECTWLITEPGRAAGLAGFLDSMRFMLAVEVRHDQDLAVLGTNADGPTLVLPDGSAPVRWVDPWPTVAPGSTSYGPVERHPGAEHVRALTLVPRAALDEVVDAALGAGARLAGVWAWEALRVAAWRPRLTHEVDDRALPHELDWLRTAVHMDKGCYRGQETVARVFNLGKPPRRLVALHLDGSEHTLPERGAGVMLDGRQVGTLTSVARHFELGPIGLALVKRTLDEQAALIVGGIAAAQEVIVGTDGAGAGRPEKLDTSGLRRRGR